MTSLSEKGKFGIKIEQYLINKVVALWLGVVCSATINLCSSMWLILLVPSRISLRNSALMCLIQSL